MCSHCLHRCEAEKPEREQMKHGQRPPEVRGERVVMISVGCVNDHSAGVCREEGLVL